MDKNDSVRVEELKVEEVHQILGRCGLEEYQDLVREKQLDGRKLVNVTEGIVKLWSPKTDAKKFIRFVDDLKQHPDKYFNENQSKKVVMSNLEAKYQIVNKRSKDQHISAATVSGVEEIINRIVPLKSFLYRNQPIKRDKAVTSYVPMEGGKELKSKRFRFSNMYNFDIRGKRFSRQETFNDRGYYSVKSNKQVCKIYRKPESRKYSSLSEDIKDLFPEDHFYEDLCYNEVVVKKEHTEPQNANDDEALEHKSEVKPRMIKIQELFHTIKRPFLKKSDIEVEIKTDKKKEEDGKPETIRQDNVNENDVHIYENSDGTANMYDVVGAVRPVDKSKVDAYTTIEVEEYLEPVQVSKDYCDVCLREKEDSILGYIINLFENKFWMKRETSDGDEERGDGRTCHDDVRHKMADRPLPVPVENEPYYMNVDRGEAENLLRGQPDGTFVLRPSSQPEHAYTLSVSCAGCVYNVGVRRRSDGRLALGFARRGALSFGTVGALLQHHRSARLLLVSGGRVCGATKLTDTPHYYQAPSSLPLTLQ